MKRNTEIAFVVGIDEVGRGPLAGPVAVGAVCVYAEHYTHLRKLFPVVRDSKKLSPKARGEWLVRIRDAEKAGLLVTAVAFVASSVIDKKGIASAIRMALAQALEDVAPAKPKKATPSRGLVLLDGGLRAPLEYKNQRTIIKGDEKELLIALASIVAKVARDARMVKLGKKFPAYGFERHKGYGTRAHYDAIKQHGITTHHRRSFLKSMIGYENE